MSPMFLELKYQWENMGYHYRFVCRNLFNVILCEKNVYISEYVPLHEYEEPKISLDHMEHAETVSSKFYIDM